MATTKAGSLGAPACTWLATAGSGPGHVGALNGRGRCAGAELQAGQARN